MTAIIAIAILFLAACWVVAIVIRAARLERKQRKETEAIRYMDSAELEDIINEYKS